MSIFEEGFSQPSYLKKASMNIEKGSRQMSALESFGSSISQGELVPFGAVIEI